MIDEKAYVLGQNEVYLELLQSAMRGLGVDFQHPDAIAARWIKERADIISTLRQVCEDFGDNRWSDDLNLSDVIENHLVRYLKTWG